MSQRKKDKRSHRNDFYRGEEKSEARTLFNPQSDHPIDFNKSDISINNNNNSNSSNSNNNVRRKAYSSQRQHSTEPIFRTTVSKDFLRNNERETTSTSHLPNRPSNGVLWDPNSKESNKKDIVASKPSSSPKQHKQRQQVTPIIQKISMVSTETSNDIVEHNANSRINSNNINNKVRSTKPSSTLTERTTNATTAKPNNNNNNNDNNNNQRTRLKNLIHRVSQIENQIDQLSKVAKQNSYFRGIHEESGHSMSHPSVNSNMKIDDLFAFQRSTPDMFQSDSTTQPSLLEKLTSHPWLNMNEKDKEGQIIVDDDGDDDNQWRIVDQLWKDKMKLHIQLANTYLDIMQLDYEYSEKKNLEGLCWKRAIYSLVEEFRHAIRRQQSLMTLLHLIEKSMTISQSPTTLKTKQKKVVLDKDGNEKDNSNDVQDDQDDEEDDDDDNNDNETATQFEIIDDINLDDIDDSLALPVLSENGMTMLQLSDDDSDESKNEDNKKQNIATSCRILDKHLNKLKLWMGTFLTLSDEFYQRVMAMLWAVDEPLLKSEIGNDTATTSISILSKNLHSWQRNQKWKWYKCISFRGDLARYRYIYVDLNTYQTAWHWYTLGAWLMPTTGRFYFHQSLLLNSPQYSSLYEFHKLYFSVKSLMVRRNPFVNSREGLIGLFENNRQWYSKVITTTSTLSSMNKRKNKESFRNRKGNRQLQQKQQKKSLKMKAVDFNSMVTGTLIRLHGMLFTKIDLDTFAQTKRHYFDTLFFHPHSSFPQPISSNTNNQPSSYVTADLNGSQLYWLESIILNISSLYNFNYSTSPLTKLLSINKRIWLVNNKEDNKMNDDDMNNILKKQQEELHQHLESLKDSILFSYAIDLVCQTAVELLTRYVKYNNHEESVSSISSPSLPTFPSVPLSIQKNRIFLFGEQNIATTISNEDDFNDDNIDTPNNGQQQSQENNNDNAPWFIYIELLLQWMLVSGICIRTNHFNSSIWEVLVGRIIQPNERHSQHDTYDDESKIIPSFWSLLMSCFTKLLHSLPEEHQYKLMDWHLMNNDDDNDDDDIDGDHAIYWNKYVTHILKMGPSFPEEEEIRGLGWMDDLFVGKYQDSKKIMKEVEDENEKFMEEESRRIRILNYGFWLVKQMSHVLEFDPVNKIFLVNCDLLPDHSTKEENIIKTTEMLPILTAMDDAVLFESDTLQDPTTFDDEDNDGDEHGRLYNDLIFNNNNRLSDDNTDKEEEDDDDGMVGQLKKRREQLQSMINTMTEEKKHLETFGYQPLSNRRIKERELRLNRLREKVIPGQTVLVFDTNCFIGHLETIRKLFQDASWSIVIPLVVVTELDGLKGNAPPLGAIADDALKLIETTLAKKPRRDHPSLRIQTSHHNFLYDISIRSEQFVFGETDKNLDDLVLSTCLWWMKKQQRPSSPSSTVPVCLVTADRNLSVKARARDVQVIPVSGLIEINP